VIYEAHVRGLTMRHPQVDTAAADPFAQRRLDAGIRYPLQGRSLALLRQRAYR
jgi:hypothetical protein